jgi:hypothetical protein
MNGASVIPHPQNSSDVGQIGAARTRCCLEKDRLYAVARRIVHDASRAEDVIHDHSRTFSDAWPHDVRLTKNGAEEDLAY